MPRQSYIPPTQWAKLLPTMVIAMLAVVITMLVLESGHGTGANAPVSAAHSTRGARP